MVNKGDTRWSIARCLDKFGYATEYAKMPSAAYSDWRTKMRSFVRICKKYDVIPYVGGGMTEEAMREHHLLEWTDQLHALGIDTIEVSNSNGEFPAHKYAADIASLRKDFARVLVEIGTKEMNSSMKLDDWRKDLDTALEQDATNIILEGVGDGTGGIYEEDRRGNSLLVSYLTERAGAAKDRFIVEAPKASQQEYWINELFGWGVKLGNLRLRKNALASTDRLRLDAMQAENAMQIDERRAIHETMRREVFAICKRKKLNPDLAFFNGRFHGTHGDKLLKEPQWRIGLEQCIREMAIQSKKMPDKSGFAELDRVMAELFVMLELRLGKDHK
jgi:phosphosulfolactate synthase (CoM biosynthesis protein A)